jgi:branched-chain amino acid transport system permease protein
MQPKASWSLLSRRPISDGGHRGLGLLAGAASLMLLTLLCNSVLNTYYMSIYDTFLLACLGAVALNFLMGTGGQVSIGNAAFLAVGGFGTAWLERMGMGFPWSVLGAVVLAGLAGAVVGLPAVRLRGLALGLATLAAIYIVTFFTNLYQQDVPSAGPSGFFLPSPFPSAGIAGAQKEWSLILTGVVIVVTVVVWRLVSGKSGRALRLIRDHEVIAGTVGVRVFRYKFCAFVISSAIIGLEGSLAAYVGGQVITDNYTLALSVQYLAMILIGGLDSIPGAFIGAAVISALPSLVQSATSATLGSGEASLYGGEYSQIIYGALALGFILWAPGGLAGIAAKTLAGWWHAVRLGAAE